MYLDSRWADYISLAHGGELLKAVFSPRIKLGAVNFIQLSDKDGSWTLLSWLRCTVLGSNKQFKIER